MNNKLFIKLAAANIQPNTPNWHNSINGNARYWQPTNYSRGFGNDFFVSPRGAQPSYKLRYNSSQQNLTYPYTYTKSINDYLNKRNATYYSWMNYSNGLVNNRFTTAKLYYDPATKTNRSWNDAIADAGRKWQQSGNQEDRLRYVALRLKRNAQKWKEQSENRNSYIYNTVLDQRAAQNAYLANKKNNIRNVKR